MEVVAAKVSRGRDAGEGAVALRLRLRDGVCQRTGAGTLG